MTLIERLMAKVHGQTLTGCWIWTGTTVLSRSGKRYGRVRSKAARLGGKMVLAHRASYESFVGPITGEIDHLCRETLCINPSHLRDVDAVGNAWSHKRDASTGQYTHDDQWEEEAI